MKCIVNAYHWHPIKGNQKFVEIRDWEDCLEMEDGTKFIYNGEVSVGGTRCVVNGSTEKELEKDRKVPNLFNENAWINWRMIVLDWQAVPRMVEVYWDDWMEELNY